MKIVMLIDAWFPHIGGGQIHVWELSKELTRMGHQVKIVTRDLGEWNNQDGKIDVVRLGRFREFSNIFGRIEYLILAGYYCLKEDFDILHTHAFSPGLLVPLVKLFKKVPAVFTAHGRGVKIAGLGIKGDFLQRIVFYKIAYDLMISVAKGTLSQKPKSRLLKIIPNGVDINKFKTAIKPRDNIRTILYIGRLSFEKGVDLLLEAFRELGNKELKLIIVGEGPEGGKLRARSKNLKVEFLGRLEGKDLLTQMKKADLLVIPSRTEGHPLILFEGWASKIPILASKVGDIPLYLKDGENGFLVEAEVSALVIGLKRAVKSKRLKSMVDKAFMLVNEFSWERVAVQTEKGYKKIYAKS